MLIAELDKSFPNWLEEKIQINDLQSFYQNSKKNFDSDEDFKKIAHQNVVKLQSGDEHCIAAWTLLCEISRVEYDIIYERMDIKIKEVGESFFNPFLGPMVDDLLKKGVAEENEGAIVVFTPKNKVPLIIRKSDGGFAYDTTDMAALDYRVNTVGADRVIVVTDIS